MEQLIYILAICRTLREKILIWAILNSGPYGVSIHHVNTKTDSGKIIFRKN